MRKEAHHIVHFVWVHLYFYGHPIVTISLAEVEYVACNSTAYQVVWMKKLISDHEPTTKKKLITIFVTTTQQLYFLEIYSFIKRASMLTVIIISLKSWLVMEK